jgi:hypothetical protein
VSDQILLLPPLTEAERVVTPSPGRARKRGPATSRWSADEIAVAAGKLQHRVLAYLAEAGARGATDNELWRACDPNGRTHSAANRRKELDEMGLVRDTTITRPTDRGRAAFVHVITERGLEVFGELGPVAA